MRDVTLAGHRLHDRDALDSRRRACRSRIGDAVAGRRASVCRTAGVRRGYALAVKYAGCVGGLYAWTRADFGPWHGFLCFWVYWIGIAFLLPTAALFYMSAGFYALGPKYVHLA